MKTAYSLLALAAFGMASTASAQLVITNLNTPTLIDFDSATPGIYHPRTGTGGTFNIIEPNSWQLDNFNADQGSGFLSNGVANSYGNVEGYVGQGNNSPTHFANDGNGNGQTNNEIGFGGMAVYRPDQPEATGLNSNAFRLAINNDWAQNGQYFRIQNNTGATVSQWTFTADLFIAEPDASNFSNIQFSYAVDNGVNPATMTFTTFGGSPTITQGMTLSGTPQFQLNSTVSATVAHGDYIVLAFNDLQTTEGSTVFVDNIGITAIPEPSTLALAGIALSSLLLVRRRRRAC
jgi:hypothetical protein